MNGAPWGGSEEQWFQVALHLAQKGVKVDTCFFDWPEKTEKTKRLEDAGCKLILLQQPRSIISQFKNRRTLSSIDYTKYDLVFMNQGGFEDVTHGPFKFLYKKFDRYALTFHNYTTNAKLKEFRINSLRGWIENATVILSASHVITKVLQESFKITSERVEVVYAPLGFNPPGASLPFSPLDKISFTVLAALDVERKAQDQLITAFANKEWENRNWELNLYGEGKDRDTLQQLIKKYKLQEKIFLRGHSNDVKEILRKTHVLLQITHKDAMPIAVMEAMSLGRPCIVSNVGDMPVWVRENETGFICSKVNSNQIHKTLNEAWEKKNNWEAMGKNAFAFFKSKYPPNYSEYVEEIFERYSKK